MNIHEYQAKKILSRYGVKIPKGVIAYTPNEAREAADKVSEKGPWVLKAQIQSGARKNGYFLEKDAGAEGGIRIVTSRRKIRANADEMLGSTLVTVQTGPSGKKVNRIYVEAFCAVEKAFYMAIAVSRVAAELTLLVAKDYDGDVLQVALTKPEKILKVTLGLEEKITSEQIAQIMKFLKLSQRSHKSLERLVNSLHKAFWENDASMIEINPVGVMKNGELIALDAKISFDDNALFRHPDINLLQDDCEISEREQQAAHYKFTYSEFDGSVGCIVNGDGVALTAMDLLRDKNTGTACFINVKGGVDKDKIASGIKIIMTNPRVEGILLNILGGFLRCDLIADGIISAASEVGLNVPMVVRFEGTNQARAKEILENSRLPIIWADTMEESIDKLVKALEEAA